VGDPVDDDAVLRRIVHPRGADFHQLGGHALVAAAHLFDESGRKTPLPPDDQTDLGSHAFTPQ
jgi:hypothetical protein